FERVERRLNGRSYSPLLDIRADDLVTLAELIDEARGIGFRQAGQEEIIVSGKGVVYAGPSGLDEKRGGDTVARRHASEDKCFLHVFGIAHPGGDARRLLSGIILQPAHL